jgi:hypothetical protein
LLGGIVKRTVTAALAAAFLCLASEAGGPAPPAPPDPAKLSMPPLPLVFTEKDKQAADSRYYYYKDGVSYEHALADLQLCNQYAHTVELVAKPKDHVPLGSDVPAPDASGKLSMNMTLTYGLVAGFIAVYVEGELAEGSMRVCMMYRGYKRHAVSREAYRAITRGSDAEAMARQAIVASGPAPQGGEVGP